jgi:AraC family transcriptional regulator, regulatory protein of adaptative response / methylated-DNA-[protein]-cysteine methyltransferase
MLDAGRCWAAVVAHDAGADGSFFYAVKTTGVFCRPGCASRRPRPENVAFYETATAAEAAGFRPCKRCRPNDPSAAERHLAAIERACALIRARDSLPSLAELADAAGLSRFHFHRLFKQATGTTPREWARAWQLGRFAERLEAGEAVADAVYAAGFGASSRAYAVAPTGLGMTPAARRRGGKGERVRWVIVPTAIGQALVAATDRGICLTALGDDRASLEAELHRRLPAADLTPADATLSAWAAEIAAFVTHPRAQPDLPLDIGGTAFQAQVWQALRKIPPGQTRTYREIAAALGRPQAVRAVAQACARNQLAMLVPCHRVIRSDGDPAGYRWGAERKRQLLAREHAAVAAPADAVAD